MLNSASLAASRNFVVLLFKAFHFGIEPVQGIQGIALKKLFKNPGQSCGLGKGIYPHHPVINHENRAYLAFNRPEVLQILLQGGGLFIIDVRHGHGAGWGFHSGSFGLNVTPNDLP